MMVKLVCIDWALVLSEGKDSPGVCVPIETRR
jgi:hypothetical protein